MAKNSQSSLRVFLRKELTTLLEAANNSALKRATVSLDRKLYRMYFRIGPRLLGDNRYERCIQLASININDTSKQNNGIFNATFAVMKEFNLPIFVESVVNDEFANALLRRGFIEMKSDLGISEKNFYLMPPGELAKERDAALVE